MAAPAKTIFSSQPFQRADGTPASAALGFLRLEITQVASVIAGGIVDTQPLVLPLDANGKLPSTACWYSDELSPSGITYQARLYGSNGLLLINDLGYISLTGAGPTDLSLATFTGGPGGVLYSGAVLLTPTGSQVITTGNLTLTTGSFIETAAAATGSGGLVRKVSPALTTPDIGVATGTSLALGGGTALTTTNRTGTGNLVLATGPTITNTTQDIINQKSGTAFILKDETGGTRLSIPSGGVAQSTLNNTNLTGGSTITSPNFNGAIVSGSMIATGSVANCGVGAGVGAACANTITWSATLSSSTYRMLCESEGTNVESGIGKTSSKTTTTAQVDSINFSAGTALTASSGTIRCVAIV